jgi:sodium-dependent dicarboxylate transporter 2/3/5
MMPVATPPNAVIFGSERLHIFEMAWVGLWVKVVSLVVVLVLSALLLPLFFGVEVGVLPAWAVP